MLDHVDIRVSDLAASRRFYDGVLGRAPLEESAEHVDWGDFTIAADGQPLSRHAHLVFSPAEAVLTDPDGNEVQAGETAGRIERVVLRTRDLAAMRRFYATVGEALGIDASDDVSLVEGEPAGEHVHIAFAADTNEAVDAFHRAAIAAGYTDNGAPGERPAYHPGYYGAFVLDPDGHNIEAVNHNR